MLFRAPSGGGIATGMAKRRNSRRSRRAKSAITPARWIRFVAAKESARARHDLAYLFWECTLRCNLECRHCGSDCLRDASTKAVELPADRVCRELSAIARRYDPRGVTFAIIGGEPLIRRDIETVGAHAAALGYAWGVTTNAMLLKPARLASLKAAGLRTISVSLDGLEKAARRAAPPRRRVPHGERGDPPAGRRPLLPALRRHLLRQRAEYRQPRAVHRLSRRAWGSAGAVHAGLLARARRRELGTDADGSAIAPAAGLRRASAPSPPRHRSDAERRGLLGPQLGMQGARRIPLIAAPASASARFCTTARSPDAPACRAASSRET